MATKIGFTTVLRFALLYVVVVVQNTIGIGKLSHDVAEKINPIFKRYKPSHPDNHYLIPLVLLAPVVFVLIVNSWFRHLGLLTYFNRETLSTTISDLLLVPLSLVGLVIPFFALVVEVVLSKFGLGTIERAFLRSGLRRVIYYGLGLLVFEILTLASVRTANVAFGDRIGTHAFLYPAVFLLVITWTVIVVFLAGKAILGVFNTFRIQYALKLFMKEFTDAAMEELKREMSRNYSHTFLTNELNDSGISVSYFTPENGALVLAEKTGVVTDANVFGLKRLPNLLKNTLRDEPFSIRIATPYHHVERINQQVAALSLPVSEGNKLQIWVSRIVNACITVTSAKEEDDKLLEAHETYKELTMTLAQQQNDKLLMAALDGYRDSLVAYINLGIRLKAEDAPGVLSDWRPITLITHGLTEIIQRSAKEESGGSIGAISHWTRETMQECIRLEDEYIFSRLLRLFFAVSFYSAKSGNTIGLNRAHHEPLHILDYVLFRFGETEKVASSLVEYRVKLANLIIRHLYTLFKQTIEDNDAGRFGEMLSKLKPGKLFPYTIELPFDKWEVDFALRSTTISSVERLELEDKKKSQDILDGFKNEYQDTFIQNIHAAAGYLIEKNQDSPDAIAGMGQIFQKVWEQMGAFSQTVKWLEEYDIREEVMGGLWEDWGETRGVVSKNPMHIPFLLFTLRGLKQQSTQATEIEIPASQTIDGSMEQLMQLPGDITGGKKWESLTGVISSDTIDRWMRALEKSRVKYREGVAKSIRESTIEQPLVEKYRQEILEAYEESGVVKALIAGQQVPEPNAKHPIEIIRSGWPPKEAFISQDRIHYGDFGKEDGRSVGFDVDEKVIEILCASSVNLSIPSDYRQWSEPLDDALSRIPTSTNSKKIIFASDLGPIYETIVNLEGFVPAHQLPNGYVRGLFGELRGAPVYLLRYKEAKGFIVVDSALLGLTTETTDVEIREISDDERAASVAANPKNTDEKLREFVKVVLRFKLKLLVRPEAQVIRLIPGDAQTQQGSENRSTPDTQGDDIN